jgi:hypothetical protein
MMRPVSVSREHIIQEIERTAEANGGVPLGRGRFAAETGIRAPDLDRYWARWGDAVEEAGYSRNRLQSRYDDDAIMRPLVEEVRRLGRLPTTLELRLRRREGAPLPSANVYKRYGNKAGIVAAVVAYCRDDPEAADVVAVLEPMLHDTEEAEPNPDEPPMGFVYLIKSGRHHKLGRTNALGRRERELAIQLPERATTVHTIKTDDPAGIEAYWHRRFADRRANGEWFALTAADVQAFKRRKFM